MEQQRIDHIAQVTNAFNLLKHADLVIISYKLHNNRQIIIPHNLPVTQWKDYYIQQIAKQLDTAFERCSPQTCLGHPADMKIFDMI